MRHIDLSKKIAVVTGASGELGRVIVRVIARCGADVAIRYFRQAERANVLLGELQAPGMRAMTVQADVTQPASVAAMHEAVVHTLGPPHILVNNAVIQYHPWISVLEQPLADDESQFRSSALQNVLMAKAFVLEMIRNRYGRFIAISTECVMQSLTGQLARGAGITHPGYLARGSDEPAMRAFFHQSHRRRVGCVTAGSALHVMLALRCSSR